MNDASLTWWKLPLVCLRERCRAALLGFTFLVAGCSTQYPSVSPDCYDLAKSLTTICNLRKSDQLPKLREMAAVRQRDGKITSAEHEILDAIVQQAEGGDWEQAEADARQLLAAQQSTPAARP